MLKFRKEIGLLLAVIIFINIGSTISYAEINKDDKKVEINNIGNIELEGVSATQTDNGFTMEYEIVENHEKIYYYEECKDDIIFTSKYIEINGKLVLKEQVTTTFKLEEHNDGTETLKAYVHNLTNSTTSTEIVMEELNEKSISTQSIGRRHPKDSTYYFKYSSGGHLGFSRLTKAAIIGALGAVIGQSKIVAGSIAGIAAAVIDGQYSSLYYNKQSFSPDHSYYTKGKPIWKHVVRYYYDKNQTKKCGDTIYHNSTILSVG